jgi:hypothetical protein
MGFYDEKASTTTQGITIARARRGMEQQHTAPHPPMRASRSTVSCAWVGPCAGPAVRPVVPVCGPGP